MTAARQQSVLVIDDAQDIHDLIDVRLRSEGIQIVHALDPESGLSLAEEAPPDLILLDLDLPGKNGIEVCRQLRANLQLASVPIIFLTGTVDVAAKVRAFEAGAVDYVTKPFDAIELRARVGAALRTKRYLDLLATRARIDGLTGLWNRDYFDSRLREDVAAAGRYHRQLALLIIDVDDFKSINDSCGHPFGDLTLRKVAETITFNLRPGDVACRYGGDEFSVLLREADSDAARATAERIRDALAELELSHGGRPVPVHVSIGFATAERMPDPIAFAPGDLLAAADRGLYNAKRNGRNTVGDGQGVMPDHLHDTLAGDGHQAVEERRLLHPGSRVGRYEVLEPIGSGAMATVYRAFDQRNLREVALKVLTTPALRSEGWRRFAQEAHALSALEHPSIVRVLDHGVSDDGMHFLVLELLTGRTVRDRLFEGPFVITDALHLCIEILRALSAAHDKGIVHRDLKPENLFLLSAGGLKILDFGLAKVTAPPSLNGHPRMPATEAGVLLGTVGYLAPEQAKGQPTDARSDLFSVGTILYELVTGKRAFFRESAIETLHSVITDEPPRIGHPALDAVLRRCLAKNPAQRIGSARELEAELSRIISDGVARTMVGFDPSKILK